MSGHKNAGDTWDVTGSSVSECSLVVLQDIRDELKRLNAVLHCTNFLAIPRKLESIRRNTAKPRKRVRK
jgi:hypothetical protein